MGISAVFVRHVVELYESHAPFYEPSCQQAFAAKAPHMLVLVLQAVTLLSRLRFLSQVADLERTRLHAISQFVTCNPGIQFGEARAWELRALDPTGNSVELYALDAA